MSRPPTPRVRRGGQASSDARARVLDAARAELVASGAGAVSLRAVARRVGVSHQAITHYFADRSALFSQLAVEGLEELEGRFATARAAAASPSGEVVAALGAAYLDYASENAELFDLMFGSGAGLVDPHAQEIVEARSRVWETLLGTVSEAVATGWGGGAPAEVLALASWSTVHGLATLRRAGIGPDFPQFPSEELLRVTLTSIRNA